MIRKFIIRLILDIIGVLLFPFSFIWILINSKDLIDSDDYETIGINIINIWYPILSNILNIECNVKLDYIFDSNRPSNYVIGTPRYIAGHYAIYNKSDEYITIDLHKTWEKFKFKKVYIIIIVALLAHEMRHCYQNINKTIDFSIDRSNLSKLSYHYTPMEIDADNFSDLFIIKNINKILNISTDKLYSYRERITVIGTDIYNNLSVFR